MPKVKTTHPKESRLQGERNIHLPNIWLPVFQPAYYQPEWINAPVWRRIVENQPQLTICRDSLISSYLSLEWKIEPIDSNQRDELKPEIEYYTKLFKSQNGWDYDNVVEWIGKDLLDLPFGAGAEIGREYDKPEGQVLWFEPIDAATLFPTRNKEYPVGQRLLEAKREIYFPAHAINRIYFSPRTNIHKHGWGIAPPEKIFLAIEMIARGDMYYAKLLTDTPEAGILDLGDMAKDSAEEWVEAWRESLGGVDPYKIAVMYEHNTDTKFIPFQRSPTELMFDVALMKYMTIVCAGYGISMSDLGFSSKSSGGETLAGTIRDERRTRRTGFAIFKKKMSAFWNRMLPEDLEYKVIDTDEEFSVAMTRSRLAGATAAGAYITNRVFSPEEMRLQAVADGLITISVPEKIPDDSEFPDLGMSAERPSMLGRPVAPSSGGQGEINAKSDFLTTEMYSLLDKEDRYWRRMMYPAFLVLKEFVDVTRGVLEETSYEPWIIEFLEGIWKNGNTPPMVVPTAEKIILDVLKNESWYQVDSDRVFSDLDAFTKDILFEFSQNVRTRSYIENGVEKEISYEYDSTELKGLISAWVSAIPIVLAKSTVSGITNYLLYNKDTEIEDVLENNQMLSWVKSVAMSAMDVFVADVSNEISGIIRTNMQKIEEK